MHVHKIQYKKGTTHYVFVASKASQQHAPLISKSILQSTNQRIAYEYVHLFPSLW